MRTLGNLDPFGEYIPNQNPTQRDRGLNKKLTAGVLRFYVIAVSLWELLRVPLRAP